MRVRERERVRVRESEREKWTTNKECLKDILSVRDFILKMTFFRFAFRLSKKNVPGDLQMAERERETERQRERERDRETEIEREREQI